MSLFEGPKGQIGLLDLFEGRRQLLVYHSWFEPGAEPCEGCSMWMRNLGSVADLSTASRRPSSDISLNFTVLLCPNNTVLVKFDHINCVDLLERVANGSVYG